MNLTKINPKIWWTLIITFTWYFIFSKISVSDLWWHMACGRYFFENGIYPPTDFFSFTPTVSSNPNQVTWLGDLILYLIYYTGGEIGLHLFKFIAILMPVLLMLKLTSWKYNSWTLLAAVMIIVGTFQIHFIRNSMFALYFIPLVILIWEKSKTNYSYFILYPFVFLVWSKMHGYCVVGIAILGFIFLGEIIDQVLNKKFDLDLTFIFLVVFLFSYIVIIDSFSINPKNIIQNAYSIIETEINGIEDTTISTKKYPKDLFRIFMKSGDSDYIAEYFSPFDRTYTLMIKALFILVFCYIFFLTTLSWSNIRFSVVLPSLGAIYLSLGYLRTTPFAFLVALPFMAQSMSKIYKNSDGKLFIMPWVICISFFITTHYYYKTDNFYVLTRVLTKQPGIGRSNINSNTIPDYVLDNYPDEQLYNTYNIGGYLLWRWYGKKQVFIDGRSINYDSKFYNDYRFNFGEKYLDDNQNVEHGVFSIIFDSEYTNHFIVKGWTPVVFDTSMVVLEKGGKQIPKFIGSLEAIDDLPNVQKIKMRYFVADMINLMTEYGRSDQAALFCKDNVKLLYELDIDVNLKENKN